MKTVPYLLLSFSILLGLVSCQKDSLPLSSKSARITQCVVTGGGRNTINDPAKFPYLLYYTVTASLTDLNGVEEWGLYCNDGDNRKEYKFDDISKIGSKEMNLYVGDKSYHEKSNKRYVDVEYQLGLYVKRRGENGELKSYYSTRESYRFYYEFTSSPSVVFSNPQIISTTEIETEKGEMYHTEFSFDMTITGSLEIDYLEYKVSSNRKMDVGPFYMADGTHSITSTANYYKDTGIFFSQWVTIRTLAGEDIDSSNWLNLSGNPIMSKIEVSHTEKQL